MFEYNYLDADLYRWTEQRGVLLTDPKKIARHKLFIRGDKPRFDDLFLYEISKWISEYQGSLLNVIDKKDAIFLAEQMGIPHSDKYFDYLNHKVQDTTEFWTNIENGVFTLEYTGLWLDTILHETPLLSAISEIYYRLYDPTPVFGYKEKVIETWKDCPQLIEMGTRRRISKQHQEEAIKGLIEANLLEATSNVHWAREDNIKCVGTCSHQWFMAKGNRKGVEDWLKLGYPTNILLPDTFTTDAFYKELGGEIYKYQGFRQDSGPPIAFVDKTIDLCKKWGIDTKTMAMIFSDSLKPMAVKTLHSLYHDHWIVKFGVGSNITCLKDNRLQIVIKPTHFDGKRVFKKSDDPSKSTEVN